MPATPKATDSDLILFCDEPVNCCFTRLWISCDSRFMEERASHDVLRRVWAGEVKTIPLVLVSSVAVVWTAVLVVPGVHFDGPPTRQAQAIAVASLVFLVIVMCGRVAVRVSSMRKLHMRGVARGVDDTSRSADGGAVRETDSDAVREMRQRAGPGFPVAAMLVLSVATPFALWLSEVLCVALGLPLRIDDVKALLCGWLVVIVVRLLLGAVFKLAVMARPWFIDRSRS